jgi:hypothetical protein
LAVNLLPEENVQEGTIDLALAPATQNEATAELKTERIGYATQDKLPQAQVRQGVLLGFEDLIRQQVHAEEAQKDHAAKTQLIQEVAGTAAAEGRGLNDSEIQYVTEMAKTQYPRSKETIIEALYAKRFIEDVAKEDAELRDFTEAEPETAKKIFDAQEDYITKQQIAVGILEEAQDMFDSAGLGTQVLDFAEGIIPGVSWWNLQSAIPGTNNEGAFLGGSNVESQVQSLFFQSPEDFEKNLREAVRELAKTNVHDAVRLASAAVDFSSSDALLDNVFATLDAADIATLGGLTAIKAASRITKSARAAGAGTSVTRKAAQGNISAASQQAVTSRINNGQLTPNSPQAGQVASGNMTRPQKLIDELTNAYPGMFDPNAYVRNAGSLTATRQARLMTEVADSQALLMSTLTDVAHVERVTDPNAIASMFKEAEDRFRVTNHRFDQAIVDIVPVQEADKIFGGVDYVKVLIGQKDATSFKSEASAKNFAKNIYRLPDGGYNVELHQGNWFITMTQNVDETSLTTSLQRIQTDNAAPQTFMNQWLWGLRTPDDVVSREHNTWRKTATYGANAVMDRMRNAMPNLGKLGKNETERLRDVMQEAMFKTRMITQPDGTKKRVAGVFYEDVGSFESAYLARHGSMPSDNEIGAYFEFRTIMDWDFMMKNLAVYRDKARLGIEQYSTNVSVPVPNTKLFTQKSTPFFEGRVIEALPSQGTGTFTVGWVNPKSGKPEFGVYNKLFPGKRQDLQDAIASGEFKIIQLADPKNKELRDTFSAKGEPVQYMVVKNTKQRPLSMNQVARNEGGHWMYPQNGGYIKQAQVHMGQGRRIYDGDTTAFYGMSFDMLRGFADKFNIARGMLKNSDPNLDAYVRANLPYQSADEFGKMFRSTTNPDGTFNLDTPFVVTGHGQAARDVARLEDIFPDEIFDAGGDANSLSSQINSQWTQERSERLLSVDTVGTQANPTYKLSAAPVIDPMQSLAVSASQMARGRFYDDYKHRAVMDWATQFADTIDAPLAAVRSDPMRYLKEGKFRDIQDNAKLAAAKANRRAILSILGQDNDFNRAWKWTRQKMVDETYKRAGKKSAQILDPILWDAKTDPATIMRSTVFHAKLGLFNPAQLLLQSASASMAMAMDGNALRAARAPMAYWAMRSRGLSAANVKGQGAITSAAAKALGMDKQYLDDMHDAWSRSGMQIVEGEYGPLDDYLNPREFVSKSLGTRTLDAGTTFFKEGNNIHRGTAFSLSYMKWRDANPTRKMTNADLAQITNRADLYYINMSRASNAPWQSGGKWWQQGTAVMGQFFGFQARLTELMLGNRLTGAEKFRLFTMNSLMWGVPIGGGGTALGAFWPVGESIKEYMIATGMNDDPNLVTKVLIDGVADVVVESLTGTDFNVAERYGPGGLSYLKDFVEGNFGELFGASPNFIGQSMALAEPFLMASAGVFFGGPQYELGFEDFKGALTEISSLNQLDRAWLAYNAGDWLDKKGNLIAENVVETGDPRTAFAVSLGLTPQDVTDMYYRYQDNTAVQETKRRVSDQALREFERGIKAATDRNEEQMLFFYRRANALMEAGNFTPLERANLWKRAMQQNESMMDRVDRDFFKNDPSSRMDWYQKRWEENLGKGY